MADQDSGARLVLARLRALPWLKILGVLAVALVVVLAVPPFRRAAALGASKVVLFVASPLAPDIADLRTLPATSKVVAADGTVLAELDDAQFREPVEIDTLPDHVKQAVLAAEDEKFYDHSGVDPMAVFRAFVKTAQGRTQGGSTITQQLAKINYTARERTLMRKVREVLYATKLEEKYTKDELLQRYLNQVYFGDGAYGIQAAAQTFFGRDAKDLTPAQAAMLAGKIRAPGAVDPRKTPEATKKRRDQVLRNMREEGWLSRQEYEAARREPIELAAPRPPQQAAMAPHFVEYVKREAKTIDALGATPETRSNRLFTAGLTVETTLDPKVFNATVKAVQDRLGQPEDPVTAVATVVPGDGAIRSLFGGLDFASTQWDMSSNPGRGRQAGSSVKPFVYLAALRKGIDPRSTFDGTSGRVIECYRKEPVQNYAGEDAGGKIDVDTALEKSVNVVFAELGCKAGAPEVAKAAHDAGIPEDATKNPGGFFLGGFDGSGVNALEMTAAYATFAAKGVYAEPYAIARIKDASGKVVYERKPRTRQAFKPEEVGVLNNPLQRVVKSGTGRAAAIGRPVAGKTGTTQDNKDAWFVGYTPQLATGVWVGYADNREMDDVHGRAVTGGSFPTQIFGQLMRAAHEGLPVERLFTASPDDLDLERVSPPTTAPTTTSSTTSSTTTTTTSTTVPEETTTTAPPRPKQTTTTTTTAPPTTTTEQQSKSSSGGGAASTTTTAP